MFALHKYKINFAINFENSDIDGKILNINKNLNYVFKHKNKLFRNFILIYSVFLTLSQYSPFLYKTNPEYSVKLSLIYFLLIDHNVVLF